MVEIQFIQGKFHRFQRFRTRIKDEFDDGDKCTIHLKNRDVRPSSDEEDWYNRAFGPKRNFMTLRIKYAPLDGMFKQKRHWFAVIKYKIFEEMVKECEEEGMKFESNMVIQLDEEISDLEIPEWSKRFDLPYGTFEIVLQWRYQSSVEGDENWPLKDAEPKCLPFFNSSSEPKPISRQQQEELDAKEEKENKDRENEARLA